MVAGVRAQDDRLDALQRAVEILSKQVELLTRPGALPTTGPSRPPVRC